MIPWLACALPEEPDACRLARAPASGPLAAEAAAAPDLVALSQIRVREARRTADDGFYTLARAANDCARFHHPLDVDAARMSSFLDLQFHRFSQAEAGARALVAADEGDVASWLLLADALGEQGRVAEAAEALGHVAGRPDAAVLDRVSWLAWQQGDEDGARRAALAATSLATDPDTRAYHLAWWGWLDALAGGPGKGIEAALQFAPDDPVAHFYRGRQRLHRGDRVGAVQDLRAAGRTVEAFRARQEAGDDVDMASVASQDPRAWAIFRIDEAPAEAVALLRTEAVARQDGLTRMALLWARHEAGENVTAELALLDQLDTAEPRAQLWRATMRCDDGLLAGARAAGPGLLPSEHRAAEAAAVRCLDQPASRSTVQ